MMPFNVDDLGWRFDCFSCFRPNYFVSHISGVLGSCLFSPDSLWSHPTILRSLISSSNERGTRLTLTNLQTQEQYSILSSWVQTRERGDQSLGWGAMAMSGLGGVIAGAVAEKVVSKPEYLSVVITRRRRSLCSGGTERTC